VRAALVLWIPLAAWLGVLDLPQLYAIAMALGFASFLFEVTHQAILPAIVPADQLLEANGKLRAAGAVSEGVAFASGGWLIQLMTAPMVLIVDAVSYVISALFLRDMRVHEEHLATSQPEHRKPGSYWREMREGIRFALRDPLLLPSAGALALAVFAWRTAGVVYLLYVYEELGFQPGVLGMVFALGAMSSFVGAVVVEPISRRIGNGRTMILGGALFSFSILVLPLAPGVGWVGLGIIIFNQLGDGFEVLFDVNQSSLRQRITPQEVLGRVTGGIQFATSAAALLGVAAGGALGEALGLRTTIVVAGCAGLIGALWLILSPVRRERWG
jgi:predicted MFS family arabinose efflux permease